MKQNDIYWNWYNLFFEKKKIITIKFLYPQKKIQSLSLVVQSNTEPKYLETWVMKHIVFDMITTEVWNMTLQLDVVHNVSMIYFHNLHVVI
jgi:hypothetical protein